MTDKKFLSQLKDAYRQILFEQEIPADPAAPPMAAPPMAAPPMAPLPAAGTPETGENVSDVEKPKKEQGPVTGEGEAFLGSLLAKAFFIDLLDETEKYTISKMQENLNDDNANEVELELVKRIKTEDSKILDIDDNLFELSPAGARQFIKEVGNGRVIEGLQIKEGGGRAYLLNLLLTVLLRHFELGEVVKIQEILEKIRDKTTEGPTLDESKTESLFTATFKKYAKI